MGRYRMSARTDRDSTLLLRILACLGRHCIEIESVRSEATPGRDAFEHAFVLRTEAERIRRAAKQIGASVGVERVDYRSADDH